MRCCFSHKLDSGQGVFTEELSGKYQVCSERCDSIFRLSSTASGVSRAVSSNNSVLVQTIAVGNLPFYENSASGLLFALRMCFLTRAAVQAENLALRHQISVLQRGRKRLPLDSAESAFEQLSMANQVLRHS